MSWRRIVILGSTAGPRVAAFQASLHGLGRPTAPVITYPDLLEKPELAARALRPGDWLRIDSPDRDPAALAALYRAGRDGAEEAGCPAIADADIGPMLSAPGRIGSPAQVYYGLCAAFRRAAKMADAAGAHLSAGPEDLATCFDKTRCSRHLRSRGIPVPAPLGAVTNFDHLMGMMDKCRVRRVFVKLRHGSAAAGMMALAVAPDGRMIARTTAVIGSDGTLRATRRLQTLHDRASIQALVAALAPLGLHVEKWLPKAGVSGQICDLRVVVIGGEPMVHVLRMSRHPMTNLHLGGRRGDASRLRERMSDDAWRAVEDTARAAAAAFPSSFMLGLDIAVLAGLCDHVVLEVNGFGDHVKDVRHRGLTPQEWQVVKLQPEEAVA